MLLRLLYAKIVLNNLVITVSNKKTPITMSSESKLSVILSTSDIIACCV